MSTVIRIPINLLLLATSESRSRLSPGPIVLPASSTVQRAFPEDQPTSGNAGSLTARPSGATSAQPVATPANMAVRTPGSHLPGSRAAGWYATPLRPVHQDDHSLPTCSCTACEAFQDLLERLCIYGGHQPILPFTRLGTRKGVQVQPLVAMLYRYRGCLATFRPDATDDGF